MCIQKEKNTHTPEIQQQQNHENAVVHQEQQMNIDLQTQTASVRTWKDIYLEQTAQMKDTAVLGRKSFKSITAEQKQRNERINRAKIMTERASSYTLEVYDTLKDVNAQPYAPATTNIMHELADLEGITFFPQMFWSSEIRSHLKEYLKFIQKYDYIQRESQQNEEFLNNAAFKERLNALAPVMEAFRYRLKVYCEQNRVSLDSTVLKEDTEASRLTNENILEWYNLVQQRLVQQGAKKAGITDTISDEERTRFRKMREEAGMPQAVEHQPWQRTREEAISTHSNRLSQDSRERLRTLNLALYDAGQKEVAKLVHEYVLGTRYAVGYTEERKRLQKAIKAVDKALSKGTNTPAIHDALTNIRNYFNQMTNGTLQIPADTTDDRIWNFANDKLKEEGSDGPGSTRNSLITGLSYWTDRSNAPLFAHEPTVNDLKQRLVSNCYMVASVASLVELNPEKLKECLRDNGNTVTVRLFVTQKQLNNMLKHYRPQTNGNEETATKIETETEMKDKEHLDLDDFETIEVDVMQQAKEAANLIPVYITVNKEVPQIAGADALSAGALWMQMIEKACAYVGRNDMNGYKSLWYGEGGEFLQRLLGIEPVTDYSKDSTSASDIEAMKNQLFHDICTARERNVIYNAGTSHNSEKGLNSGHAYSVLGGKEENGQKYVLLRNPYSTNSLQYDEKGNKSMTGWGLSTGSDETYGQFYIKLDDFINFFDKVTHTNLNPPQNENEA